MESQEQTKINPWLTKYRWFSRLIRIYFWLIVSLIIIAETYSDITGDRSFTFNDRPYVDSAFFLLLLDIAIGLTIKRKNEQAIFCYLISLVLLLFFIKDIT